MDLNLSENIKKERKMVMESFNGIMEILTKENLKIIIFKEKVNIHGKINHMMVNGFNLKWMVLDNLFGKMVESILVNILMDSKKDMEHIIGLMEKYIKENGKRENLLEKEQ